jgi:hypothetical protein
MPHVLAFLLVVAAGMPARAAFPCQEDEFDAHGVDRVRIEQEDKLFVPMDEVEQVWDYLRQRLTEDKEFLASLDPAFQASWSEELFHDTYFDTPSLQLNAMQSGVRHRRRENLSDPEHVKSGRQLMQIKLNDISSNQLERAEIKYDIDLTPEGDTPEGRHPMLGRVKKDQRAPFKKRLVELGLDPESMRPILTVKDLRRRVYLTKEGKPFMSISLDLASVRLWWARAEFCEIEPELNEIAFTEADAEKRSYMETVLARVVADVRARFPRLERDLTPKYNKAFERLETQLPLRFLVKHKLQNEGVTLLVGVGVVALVAGNVVQRLRRKKRGKKSRAAPAVAT